MAAALVAAMVEATVDPVVETVDLTADLVVAMMDLVEVTADLEILVEAKQLNLRNQVQLNLRSQVQLNLRSQVKPWQKNRHRRKETKQHVPVGTRELKEIEMLLHESAVHVKLQGCQVQWLQ